MITRLTLRDTTGDYPGSDLECDKEPSMRTQAPFCLSTDIYEDSQTTLPCISAVHLHRGHRSLLLLVLALRAESADSLVFLMCSYTLWLTELSLNHRTDVELGMG